MKTSFNQQLAELRWSVYDTRPKPKKKIKKTKKK